MEFRHERIDSDPPCGRLTFSLAMDITGNGRDDIVIGGMGSQHHLHLDGKRTRLPSWTAVKDRLGFPESNLFWYENPGWERHTIFEETRLGVGHAVHDLDGDGRLDILAGQPIHHNEVFWFRQPADPHSRWERYVITDDFEKYHDLLVADVDDDGDVEVVGISQESETLFYYDVPDDPTRGPWPDELCHVVDPGTGAEGLGVADLDGDGQTELIAGTSVYHRPATAGDPWGVESIASGWDDVRVAVADVDGDGHPEVVLAEGDSPTYGSHPGRVSWFDPPEWTEHRLAEDLFCPHTLEVCDITRDGSQDVLVGEMGLGEHDEPRLRLYVNEGQGTFSEEVLSHTIPIHEGKVANMRGNGRVDIVGKSYGPDCHVDVWYNES